MSQRWLQALSVLLLTGGVAMLGVFAYHLYSGTSGQKKGIAAFEQAREAHAIATGAAGPPDTPMERPGDTSTLLPPLESTDTLATAPAPDMADWSESRIAAWDTVRSDGTALDVPEGIVRIPAIDLEVPVYTGTAEAALTRGAGRIEGTPALGHPGNVGIAAHRDGWFRALKDVRVGDAVLVETLDGIAEYRVTDLVVVEPEAVHVLAPTPRDSLTLVTCYPFYFVGSAPQRYIVRAERS